MMKLKIIPVERGLSLRKHKKAFRNYDGIEYLSLDHLGWVLEEYKPDSIELIGRNDVNLHPKLKSIIDRCLQTAKSVQYELCSIAQAEMEQSIILRADGSVIVG